MKKFKCKYNEDIIIDKIVETIAKSYQEHYSAKEEIQTLDIIDACCDVSAFSKGNIIKYITRYGKKDGKNPKDLLKAIHYIVLLYHFDHLK